MMINGANVEHTGSIVLLLKGPKSTVVGGHGAILERFRQTGQVTGFPGEGTPIAGKDDDHYDDAPLKFMSLQETYKKLRYDVDHSKKKNIFRAD